MDWQNSNDLVGVKAYADTIGAVYDGRSGVQKVREAIAIKLGEVPDDALIAPLPENVPQIGAGYMATRRRMREGRKFVCVISSTEKDYRPVSAGVNGLTFVIPRDTEQILPEQVMIVIRESIETRYRWDAGRGISVPRQVPSYPIQVLREATAEDLAAEKKAAKLQKQAG